MSQPQPKYVSDRVSAEWAISEGTKALLELNHAARVYAEDTPENANRLRRFVDVSQKALGAAEVLLSRRGEQ